METGRRGWRVACAVAAVAMAHAGVTSAGAQTPRRLFPDPTLVPRLLAGPLEPGTAARMILPLKAHTAFGKIVEGEVAVGTTVGVLRVSGLDRDDVVLLGIGGGVLARFNLETIERDLISSDWVFVLPLLVRRGGHWLRVQYFHSSAHLGDEYIERFDTTRVPFSRDAVDAVAFFALGSGVGVYAGGRWAFRVDPPNGDRVAFRGGFQLELPASVPLRPYLATDVVSDPNTDWTPQIDARLGIWLTPPESYPGARIEAGAFHGPPYQGQFFEQRAAWISIGAVIQL